MMLCVPMFVGAQTLTFTDHEPMGNMRTQVTRQFFRLVEQESKGRIRIDHHWNGELSSNYDAYETVREGTKADGRPQCAERADVANCQFLAHQLSEECRSNEQTHPLGRASFRFRHQRPSERSAGTMGEGKRIRRHGRRPPRIREAPFLGTT